VKELIIFILLFVFNSALANLQVLPTRLVLGGKNKTGSITIKNNSDELKEYEIVLVYYRMTSSGKLNLDKEEGEDSASKFVKFAPRKIKLNPGEEQVVRVIFKPDIVLNNKDYRCHIQFNPINSNLNTSDDKARKITFELRPKIGVAVPILISNFVGERKAEFKNVKIVKKNQKNILIFDLINITSSTFLIGDISIVDSEGQVVAQLNGVNSYLNALPVEIPIDSNFNTNKDKKFFLIFKSAEAYGNRELARVEIK